MATPNEDPLEKRYGLVARVLEEEFRYGLSPAEAVDNIAVRKAGRTVGEWADVRDVSHSTVSGNVAQAHERINRARLDAEVVERDGDIMVRVSNREGESHELPFSKETTLMGYDNTAELQLVYEHHTAVHGYYEDEDGNEFEATLWYDGRPSNSFENFDRFNDFGSPEAKADTILWERVEG